MDRKPVKAKSYANIAIIKYWGKEDAKQMVPSTSSISLTLGGGIFARSDVLLPLLKNVLQHAIQDQRFLPREIVTATLGNEAGRLGAVAKFLMDQGKNLS